MSVHHLAHKASETWNRHQAEQIFWKILDEMAAPQGRAKVKATLGLGRLLRINIPETQPEDFWIEFVGTNPIFHKGKFQLHQSAFREFLAAVRSDKLRRPAIVYTVQEIDCLAKNIRFANKQPIYYENSGEFMSEKLDNENLGGSKPGSSIKDQLRDNWIFLGAAVALALFFYTRTDRLETRIEGTARTEDLNKLASKDYVDGEFKAMRTEMSGNFQLLNQRLDYMGVPKTQSASSTPPISTDNH